MSSFETVYRGSVKDVVKGLPGGAYVFEFSDAYSVFDWGRMPDHLPRKGEALATLAADLFARLARPETWVAFSRTPQALALRRGNRFGAIFNELGEELQSSGLKTHFRGVIAAETLGRAQRLAEIAPGTDLARLVRPLSDTVHPTRHLVVDPVSVVRPALTSVLGRQLPDYQPTRQAPAPRLIPLEIVFRFSAPEGSSLRERVERDPEYLASRGFAGVELGAARWDFPVLEPFTKLESSDRPVTLPEALAISGISAAQLNRTLLLTAWVAGALQWIAHGAGLELADGKLEWGVDAQGDVFLVDAVGPDELRLMKDGVALSKEFLRQFYRRTPWYEALQQAKAQASQKGDPEWKRRMAAGPPPLPAPHREAAAQLYPVLTNALTGKPWFTDTWDLGRLVSELRAVR